MISSSKSTPKSYKSLKTRRSKPQNGKSANYSTPRVEEVDWCQFLVSESLFWHRNWAVTGEMSNNLREAMHFRGKLWSISVITYLVTEQQMWLENFEVSLKTPYNTLTCLLCHLRTFLAVKSKISRHFSLPIRSWNSFKYMVLSSKWFCFCKSVGCFSLLLLGWW